MSISYYVLVFLIVLIGLISVYWNYVKLMHLERQLFGHRIRSHWKKIGLSLAFSIVSGLTISGVLYGLGSMIPPILLFLWWGLALILSFFRFRFMASAVIGGLIVAVRILMEYFPPGSVIGSLLDEFWAFLGTIDVVSLLILTTMLFLADFLFLYFFGEKAATPYIERSKRGRLFGGYLFQSLFLYPIVLVVPGSIGIPITADVSLIPFPVLSGYQYQMTRTYPWIGKNMIARGSLLILFLLAVIIGISYYWPPAIWGSFLLLFAPEVLHQLNKRKEKNGQPVFVNDERGCRILALIDPSPAMKTGIRPGEIIQKINGVPIRTKKDIYYSLQKKPAYSKMEILDHDGEVRFVQRSLYHGEHHELGMVTSPEKNEPSILGGYPKGIIHSLNPKVSSDHPGIELTASHTPAP
ncbi:PDZ domain-containing protein [Microaerobacter geothermalis]|uniref:PDZ domain-containing protein n=1 Tax=Microaerobacter geothermalis TaxID=674972 RepID=UPI001F3029FE|nr:PDZ domain-containing protein [Microaerobacter geothermalis]MCF6094554.1 PDZ domain-containing protein [Microaerobacter geothermalis]